MADIRTLSFVSGIKDIPKITIIKNKALDLTIQSIIKEIDNAIDKAFKGDEFYLDVKIPKGITEEDFESYLDSIYEDDLYIDFELEDGIARVYLVKHSVIAEILDYSEDYPVYISKRCYPLFADEIILDEDEIIINDEGIEFCDFVYKDEEVYYLPGNNYYSVVDCEALFERCLIKKSESLLEQDKERDDLQEEKTDKPFFSFEGE